jgi:hypothetical protein
MRTPAVPDAFEIVYKSSVLIAKLTWSHSCLYRDLQDTSAPTVSVTRSGSGTLRAGQTETVTFTLSESSSNFASGDVTVSGGNLTGFSGSGSSYTATFTPTANASGTATISVGAGVFTDAANNGNVASSTLSISYDTQVDTTPPSITISAVVANQGQKTYTVTFTLSEPATNFASADVTVSGGDLTNFSGSGSSYTATFKLTATGQNKGSVSVAAGTFTDAAGNSNTASNTLSIG